MSITASTAHAQDVTPAETAQNSDKTGASIWDGIEEMIIRGSGGGMLVVEQTTSAISFDQELLSVERISDISDLSNFTPNLEIKSAFAASNPVLFIRGVGLDDFNANSASAVAVYLDGVYMNSPAGQLFQFFDTENADVLRGPQAGRIRNASAGAIRVQSARPTHEVDSYARFSTGNYNHIEFEGALNVPVVPDVLAARISGKMLRREGFTKNRCNGKPLVRPFDAVLQNDLRACERVFDPPFSLGSEQNIQGTENGAESWAARGQLLWDVPMSDGAMSWLLNVHGGRNESQAAQFQQRGFAPGGNQPGDPKIPSADATGYLDTDDDPFKGDYNTGEDENLLLLGAKLHGTWEVSDVHSLESISGYEMHDRKTIENTDANPRNLLTTSYDDFAWQFSQDLMVHSAWSETFDTTLGLFYFQEDLKVDNFFEDRARFVLGTEYSQDIRSVAVYGEGKWEFWPEFVLDGSLRYTQEYKKFENFSTANTSQGNAGVGLNIGKDDDNFSGVSGHVGLTWNIDENNLIYIKFTRGWKPGHFNGGSVFSNQIIEPVEPEVILAGEAGVKGSLFDDRFRFEVAGFAYDYSNLQIFALEQDAGSFPLSQLINASGARIYGAEAQLSIEPIEDFKITLNGAFLDTEYTEFSNTLFRPPPRAPGAPPQPPVPIVIDYTGNQMIGAPRWAVNGSIQYTIGLARFGQLVPRFSFSWKDQAFFGPGEGRGQLLDLPKGTIGQKAYAIMNASLGWKSVEGVLEITAWVRNLANEEARVQSFDVTDGFNFVIDAYRAPRTFGITLGYNY